MIPRQKRIALIVGGLVTEVLAKHDENYMPPEAQYALDMAGKTSSGTK